MWLQRNNWKFYPHEKVNKKSFDTANMSRAILTIRNENNNIKQCWDALVNSQIDLSTDETYAKLLTAVAVQIYWFTNMSTKIEGILIRDTNSATTSETVGAHSISQTLGAQILQMSAKNSYGKDVYTICPDAEQILMDMGWLEFRV